MLVVRCVVTKESKTFHSDYTTNYLREAQLQITVLL